MSGEFKYIRSKQGLVVKRYGTNTYIGCTKTKTGFEWTDNIVRIPLAEWTRYIKEYSRSLSDGSLVESSEKEFDNYQKQLEDKWKKESDKKLRAEEVTKKLKKGGKQHPETK